MRLLFILCLLLVSSAVQSQLLTDELDRQLMDYNHWYAGDSARSFVNTSTSLDAGSSAITGNFLSTVLKRGFITNAMKDEVSKHLQTNNNRIGIDFSTSLNGAYKTNKRTWLAGLGQREQAFANFSKDAFEVLFRGNKSYAGRTAQLATEYTYLNYDYIYFGLTHSLSKQFSLYATVNLLRGGDYVSFDLNKSTMYTQQEGEYVDFATQLDMKRYPSTVTMFPSTKGMGASLNIGMTWANEKHRFNAELRDWGWISWRNQQVLSVDSTYHYEGVEIDNLLQQTRTSVLVWDIDTIARQLGVSTKVNHTNIVLPTSLLFNYTYLLNKKLSLSAIARYSTNPSYIPKITCRATITLPSAWAVVTALSYGGYAKENLELGVTKIVKNRFIITANTYFAEYLLISNHTLGIGGSISLTKVF